MEPVFMVTSHSAAVAASIAIDNRCSIQNIDQAKLKNRLLAANQVFEWNVSQ
jgi:hypothetical protein